MAHTSKTVIVTGGSQGIGSGAVQAFLDRDYNVVATSRNVTKSKDLPSSRKLALVDGDIEPMHGGRSHGISAAGSDAARRR
jgi:NAD(P)-dependent dehydrogenase (short-subunit alcohol dehydrogenase family)